MKFHREGYIPVLTGVIILVLTIVAIYIFISYLFVRILLTIPLIIVFLLIAWFFRIPKRRPVKGENLVIAPADGKIVVIEKIREEEYFKDDRIQISIFMSPLNVHQNVYPIDGRVIYKKYFAGDYLVAWHPKSSTQNERSSIVIKHPKGTEILVKQIAGAVARRICTFSDVGDNAAQGNEFGFIKFGSRVDVILPLHAKIRCTVNDKAIGRQTILAELS